MNEIVSSQQREASVHLASQRRGIASCPVCHAVYAPIQAQGHLLQAPPQAIEAALMSMCHFCFRCRRPACPECWDEVHGVCGTCVQEVGLPFRQNALPLPGALPAPASPTPPTKEPSPPPPLICVQPGLLGQAPHTPTSAPTPRSTDPVEAVTHPLPTEIPTHTQQPASPSPAAPHDPARDTTPGSHTSTTQSRRRLRIGKILIALALMTLVLVVALIVAASLDASINRFIATLVHVDIRAEIAYLWQLIHYPW